MKHLYFFAAGVLCSGLTSCIKDEPMGAECDIEQAFIHADNPNTAFYIPRDSIVNVLSTETNIRLGMREADLTTVAPQFRLTPGATIEPASGTPQDFSNGPVTYTVTSQDKQWSKTYNVYVSLKQRTIDEIENLDFENQVTIEENKKKYYGWKETTTDGYDLEVWATGNAGFAITAGTKPAEEYPSSVLEEGHSGKGVKLTTCSTGFLGALVKMPIAAGNLFTGRFDPMKALGSATEATMFGVPVAQKPISLSGYYQYTPGGKVTDKFNKPVEGKTDKGDIYAVLYYNVDKDGNEIVLNGENIKTSPYIVAMAMVDEVTTTEGWTQFNAEFQYNREIDKETLWRYGYNMAIVCSSSINGAYFEGAVGSTLLIDEFKITYEDVE